MITLVLPRKFLVTLENYDGQCRRVTIAAHSSEDAMAMAQKRGWYAVDVKEMV